MEILARFFVSTSIVIFSLGMLNSLWLSLRFTLGGHSWQDLEAEEQLYIM